MKKIFMACLLTLVFLTIPVSAEKIKFKDPGFDYKGYTVAQISNIALLNVDNKDFVSDQGAENKITLLLRQAFVDRKVTLRTPEQIKETATQQSSLKAVPEISVKVYCLGYDKIYHGPWSETVAVTRPVYAIDGWGHWGYIYVPDIQVVHHPAGYYYNAEADIEFNVTDARSGKVIYTVRDSRGRGGETDSSGMLKRICNDFVEDVTKN